MNNLQRLGLLLMLSLCAVASGPTAYAQPCGVGSTASGLATDAAGFGRGLTTVPRESVKPQNLKWELPMAAGTAVLIAWVDKPAADRIQSVSLQNTAARWSNIGLGMELGTAGATWLIGCAGKHEYAAETGFKALEASGLALTLDLGLKVAFNRQYPYSTKSSGEFWEGGKSFPSGHAATSFAFASAMAHRYPHNRWIKWGSYALATGVSLSRYPAKKHFLSDIAVGAPVGYFVGRYIGEH